MKEIQLTQNQVTLVDDEDYEYLKQYRWYAQYNKSMGKYYAVRASKKNDGFKNRIKISMHRTIMKTPQNLECDHIDGNTLNNQKSNLRNCTRLENQYNVHKNIPKTSKYKGVHYGSTTNKYHATIACNNKDFNLGAYDSELEAAMIYDIMAKKLFKEFAWLNFSQNAFLIKYEYIPKSERTTSKYIGVHYYKERNNWQVYINKDKKRYNLGYFNDELEAAKAYNIKAIELFGSSAKLNIL